MNNGSMPHQDHNYGSDGEVLQGTTMQRCQWYRKPLRILSLVVFNMVRYQSTTLYGFPSTTSNLFDRKTVKNSQASVQPRWPCTTTIGCAVQCSLNKLLPCVFNLFPSYIFVENTWEYSCGIHFGPSLDGFVHGLYPVTCWGAGGWWRCLS